MKEKILKNLEAELLEAKRRESESGLAYLNSNTQENDLNYKLDQGYVNGILEAIDIVRGTND
jgi:hypothetical protein